MSIEERIAQVRREMADICAEAVESAISSAVARERAAVVAWLRAEAPRRLLPHVRIALAAHADEIERGAHLEPRS